MKFDLRSLEIFYWVAELQSFRRAAARLNTSQPAVSQRIAALEEDCGAVLLVRGARRTMLTPKGRQLKDFAERFLRLSDEMALAFGRPDNESGTIRLGVAETLVHTWLSAFVEQAHRLFPNLTLDIEVDVTSHLLPALQDGQIDMAFLIGPVQQPGMLDFPLCAYPMAFIAHRDLPLHDDKSGGVAQPGALIARAEIARAGVITFPTQSVPFQSVRDQLSSGGSVRPRLYSNSSLSSMVRMTLDRIGISVIPPVVVQDHLDAGDLVVLRTDMTVPELTFVAALRTGPGRALCEALARLAQQVATARVPRPATTPPDTQPISNPDRTDFKNTI